MRLFQTVPLLDGFDTIHKFGEIPDFDSIDTNEDVWDNTGAYPFPAAAAATTIISDDTDDDGDPAGTGAQTVKVFGLDANYMIISETATMDGTDAVTLSNQYLRVYRAFVVASGASGPNVGNIDVKHGATVIGRIRAGLGQTLMAIYTIPSDYDHARMIGWNAAISANITTSARVAIQAREAGGSWLTKELTSISNTDSANVIFPLPTNYPAQTDLRLRVLSATANSTTVAGGFDLLLRR
jgi:hypothetical protein